METLQIALKALYGSLGGNYADVDTISDINDLILAIANLDIGEAVAKTGAIPAAPDDDGEYVLTATVTDGVAAYTWESTT